MRTKVKPRRLEVFKYTIDNWCPNHENNTVSVSFFQMLPPDDTIWRVAVWGNDDLGMDRDFKDKELASLCFFALINEPYISFNHLYALGFERF